jgi:hypothetical protein
MSKPASNSSLDWKVFVTPAIATVSDDLPPGETARMWSPTSSILICGERDAIGGYAGDDRSGNRSCGLG